MAAAVSAGMGRPLGPNCSSGRGPLRTVPHLRVSEKNFTNPSHGKPTGHGKSGSRPHGATNPMGEDCGSCRSPRARDHVRISPRTVRPLAPFNCGHQLPNHSPAGIAIKPMDRPLASCRGSHPFHRQKYHRVGRQLPTQFSIRQGCLERSGKCFTRWQKRFSI